MEIFLILVVVLIVFGIGKLPQVGSGMGKAIREFRSNVKDEDEDVGKISDTTEEEDSERKAG
tara:strand:+ start:132 stop:317 length:186 start_codon:yes stop_codon:yes gene_type:complete